MSEAGLVIPLAVALAFVGTALAVMVLLAALVPAPDPQVLRLRQLGAGQQPGAPRSATNGTWSGLRAALQRLLGGVGRALTFEEAKARSTWGKRFVQAGYRGAGALFVFQGARILLAALLPTAGWSWSRTPGTPAS